MSATYLEDSNAWEERRHDVEQMQRDDRAEMEYQSRLADFQDGTMTLSDVLSPDECVDLLVELEALAVEVSKKMPPRDAQAIMVDMIRETWEREAQRAADEVQ